MKAHRSTFLTYSLLALSVLLAHASLPGEKIASAAPPLFSGLGLHGRKVTTNSAEAQAYFNQGLAFLFAFNHDESIRAFEHAANLDPDCAMAWWGVSVANGPHINNPVVPPARAKAAWIALQKARACAKTTPTERQLIDALSHRYADPQPENRRPLDDAFASAMRKVWQANPTDADIAAR